MPLEEILDRIQKDTEKEELALISKSEEETRKIIEDAKNKASSIKAVYEEKAREDAETEKRQRTSSATLEGRSFLEQEREKIENNYHEALRSKLIDLLKTDEYLEFLKKAISDARKILGQDAIVYLSKDDSQRMKEKGITSSHTSDKIGPLGGAVVTSADGKMIIDLTFSEIVRNKSDGIRKVVRDYIDG